MVFFLCKQKTAYEMRISDWSSDVCSSDLALGMNGPAASIARSVVMVTILVALQIGYSAIVLRQLKRLDGLVPYLVADNWATFFITLGSTALALTKSDERRVGKGWFLTVESSWCADPLKTTI